MLFAVIVIGVLTGNCAHFSAMPTWTQTAGVAGIDDRFCCLPRSSHHRRTSIASLITGWRRTTATLAALSPRRCWPALWRWGLDGVGRSSRLGGLLRADALTVVIVIGIVGTLAHRGEHQLHRHRATRAYRRIALRLYEVLTPAFLCAMVLAVCANNISVI